MAGVYGAVENLKGSWQNLINTIGTANEGLIKSTADMLGNAVDSFSKLDKTTQQALSLAGGGAALAGGAYGAFNLGKALLGFGGGAAALTGSAAALTTSAGLLDAAALRLAGGSVGSGIGAGVGAAAGGAAVGGVSLGLGGTAVAAGALAGGALDMLTPGTNGGIGDALLGRDSSLQQSMKALAAERRAQEALKGYSPLSMGGGRTMTLPGGAGPGKGFTSQYEASRGSVGDFLLGKEKRSITFPTAPMTPKADASQIEGLGQKIDEVKTKGSELGAMTIRPNVDGAGVGTIIQQLQTAIGLVQTLGSGIDTAKAKAASMPSPNVGGGARTGSVAQRLQNTRTDTGM